MFLALGARSDGLAKLTFQPGVPSAPPRGRSMWPAGAAETPKIVEIMTDDEIGDKLNNG